MPTDHGPCAAAHAVNISRVRRNRLDRSRSGWRLNSWSPQNTSGRVASMNVFIFRPVNGTWFVETIRASGHVRRA